MKRVFIILSVGVACVALALASALLIAELPLSTQPVLIDSQSSRVFDAKLTYAYTGLTNATGEGHDHFGWGIETYPSDYYPVTAILNLTYRGNPQNESYDIVCEGYIVNFTANTGASVSVLGWLGTNYNASCKGPPMPPFDSPWGHFSCMYYCFKMSSREIYFLRATDGGGFSSVNGTLGLWGKGTPNSVTVTIQRAGWLIFQGNETSSVVNPAVNDVIDRIELQAVGEGFGFGTYPAGEVY